MQHSVPYFMRETEPSSGPIRSAHVEETPASVRPNVAVRSEDGINSEVSPQDDPSS
jgi:hypothetical protein